VQDIGIVTSRPVSVVQTASSASIVLTFRGTRDAPHVTDKDTRLRITMLNARAQELRRQLTQALPTTEQLDWQPELLELLEAHRGETGADENAVDVLRRLSPHWRDPSSHKPV